MQRSPKRGSMARFALVIRFTGHSVRCGVWFDCTDASECGQNLLWCTDEVVCVAGDTAKIVADNLAAEINSHMSTNCGPYSGFTAVSSGNMFTAMLTITSADFLEFECCLRSSETWPGCGDLSRRSAVACGR